MNGLKYLLWLLIFGSLSGTVYAHNPISIGHRGACGHAPENTLTSFAKALELGCDMIEFDVYRCKTGQLVVIHDSKLDRTTNGFGRVKDKTLSELKSLDAGEGQTIPTVDEVLALIDKKVKVNLELKDRDIAIDVVRLIDCYVHTKGWSYKDFLVSSFDHYLLQKVARLDSRINIGILLGSVPLSADRIASAVGARYIVTNHVFVHSTFVQDVHACGLKLFVFTVNDPDEIARMKELGVDGIISNYPDRTR